MMLHCRMRGLSQLIHLLAKVCHSQTLMFPNEAPYTKWEKIYWLLFPMQSHPEGVVINPASFLNRFWFLFFFLVISYFFIYLFLVRIIALQYCVDFCYTWTRITHRYTFVPPELHPSPPPHPPAACLWILTDQENTISIHRTHHSCPKGDPWGSSGHREAGHWPQLRSP